MTMKKVVLSVILMLVFIPSWAQSKKALKVENEALKKELSEARARLDSLLSRDRKSVV